jgi:LysM repeat protein
MAKTYTVKLGDTLNSIALENGFYSWDAIITHSQNKALFDAKSDPTDLYVGDQLYIPDKQAKTVEIKSFGLNDDQKQKYTFIRKTLTTYISVYLEDDNEDPYANKKYEVVVDGQKLPQGTTDANGLLQQEIPLKAKNGIISLWPDANSQETVTWNFELGATDPNSSV